MGEPIDVYQALTVFEESSYPGLRVVCPFAPSRLSWIIRTSRPSGRCFNETHELDGVWESQ